MIRLFSSESVTEGHPDKVCDQISDGVLDAILAQDPNARVACESIATTGMVLVTGEISCDCYVDIPQIVRSTLLEIGYNGETAGFDGNACSVPTCIDEQSPDIAMGVDNAMEARAGSQDDLFSTGAGDQGMMFGYACNETDTFMPMPIELAHRLTRRLAWARKSGRLKWLRPDGKSLVSVRYENERPAAVDSVVISAQHDSQVSMEILREGIIEEVIKPIIPAGLMDKNVKILVNPTGRFVVGGPHGDSGLTGRKIIVDSYGGCARHGGGAFSGKDPTKVDRSAAYMARYIAKNIVAAGLADKCEIQLAYAIGVAQPVSVYCECFGTNKIPLDKLAEGVRRVFDLPPAAIISRLDLRRPIYKQTAAYGHFGRNDLDLPWERLDAAEQKLKAPPLSPKAALLFIKEYLSS